MKAWAMQYNDKIKPITDASKKYHWLRSAKWIFVHDKDGNATCSRCGKDIVVQAKHKAKAICPSCKHKLIAQHDWRMSKKIEVINWMVIPKAVDNDTLCLRYVLAYQKVNNEPKIFEAARLFISEKYVEPEYYCKCGGEWSKGKSPYFVRPSFMTPNRFFCLYGYEYPRNFYREADKLDCFKHYSSKNEYDRTCVVSQFVYLIHAARLNEKLAKVGMNEMIKDHKYYFVNHSDRVLPVNYKETSLIKMLKLDKPRFNLLKDFPSMTFMFYLQDHPEVNVNQLREAKGDTGRYKYVKENASKLGVSFSKLNKYLDKVNYSEHLHYISNLKELGYNIKDEYYSMPRDFEEADDRIADEYMQRFNKSGWNTKKKNDKLIKKISDGFRKMPNLKEFMDGSRGLLIYVPESSQELEREGRLMHCCLGTYPTRIAEGKTLVFFVRKLDNPTAPFVAFEYYDGKVVQCRYAYNKTVDDEKVLKFVDGFVNALKTA